MENILLKGVQTETRKKKLFKNLYLLKERAVSLSFLGKSILN